MATVTAAYPGGNPRGAASATPSPTNRQEIAAGAAELALIVGVIRLAEGLARRRLDNHEPECGCGHCTLMARQEHDVRDELAGAAWQLGKLAQAVEMMTTDRFDPSADGMFGEHLNELAELSDHVDAAIEGNYGPVVQRERENHERLLAAIAAETDPVE